ncbi:salt tolerance receptor-like cytoplasmic kinase 1 [Macadamia integrifolia]|uniref:salt tolerance receptor-like cytoplasmic kinase 1 n=1 Tax=Macadamia integrifolia TaxID=60698 RepID=UPI001C4E6616|nr:salt tolerance receptor-like cytoplasmic kinase 1 [Macadamia integrifolia]
MPTASDQTLSLQLLQASIFHFKMAFFKFLKLKISCKSNPVVDDVEHGSLSTKTMITSTHDQYQPDGSQMSTTSSVNRFTWKDMENVSRNFSEIIGFGGFSVVYLAKFPDSTLGVLKKHCDSQRHREVFKRELEVLLHIRHENIVKFLGYCDEKDEGILVFEYVSNGTLHDKLRHEGQKGSVLSWRRRMSIAYQLAQAINYLHTNFKFQIINGDIKSSNVLLDEKLNCKLCDFGSAKIGFSSTIVPSSKISLMGSVGYMDPHYMRTGIASKKNDVYSYGVIILELLTGLEAFCSEKEQLLISIANPVLQDPNKVLEMIDTHLGGHFYAEEAIAMANIAALCLHKDSTQRPSMSDIVYTIKEKIQSISFVPAVEGFKNANMDKWKIKYIGHER